MRKFRRIHELCVILTYSRCPESKRGLPQHFYIFPSLEIVPHKPTNREGRDKLDATQKGRVSFRDS